MSKNAKTIMTSIRLSTELHEQLRRIAFENRTSMHSLLLEGAKYAAAKVPSGSHGGNTIVPSEIAP